MVEIIVRDYLIEKLKPIDVYLEKPANPPTEYIFLEKVGSSMENHIESATMAIQSYSDTLYGAARLNELVKDTMFDIIELNSISKVELNSDYNYTDTTTKRYRYQAVFDLVIL